MLQPLLPLLLAAAPLLPALPSTDGTVQTSPAEQQHVSPCAEMKRADGEMKAIYKQVVVGYAREKTFLVKLRESQKAWLKYRDAQLELAFPERNKSAVYGPTYSSCACLVLAQLTQARTDQLRYWSVGASAGESCPGSIHVQAPKPSPVMPVSPTIPRPMPDAGTAPPRVATDGGSAATDAGHR